MDPSPVATTSRERILDAAARVMHERGLVNATTKLIAAEAGYSEAMLYKHFADKQELFLAVLERRSPSVRLDVASAGKGELVDDLAELVEQLMDFFTQTFPIAASIFGAPELLAQHRQAVTSRGHGPSGPVLAVQAYLEAERAAGRIGPAADVVAAARLLVGAAFHQGFLAAFDGAQGVPDAERRAAGIAAIVATSLGSGDRRDHHG